MIVHDCACQHNHACTCVQQVTWAMLVQLLKGVNYPASRWDVAAVQSRDWDEVSETTATDCSLGRGFTCRIGLMAHMLGGLYLSISKVVIYNKIKSLYELKIYARFSEFLFVSPPPLSLCLAVFLYLLLPLHLSVVKRKTFSRYCRVSRACKSLGALPEQLQAQPAAPYLGLCAVDVSSGTWRHGGGRLEG